MAFFNFRNQNKFQDIAKILSNNETTSKASLHEKHPHTKDIFERHNIDLRQIRKKGVKAATAATVLGAFLAFPHLLGNPSMTEPKHEPDSRTLSVERELNHPSKSSHHQNSQVISQNSVVNGSSGASSIADPVISAPTKKSQGHIHGRSYLAPPKDHGYHDLGLHQGEGNGQGKAESPGPHPEDLGINHPDKGEG